MALSTSAIYTGNKTRVGGVLWFDPAWTICTGASTNASFNYTKQCTVLNQNLISLPKYSVKCYTTTFTAFSFFPPTETPDWLTGSQLSWIALLVVVKARAGVVSHTSGYAALYLFFAAPKAHRWHAPDLRQHQHIQNQAASMIHCLAQLSKVLMIKW